jgi:hypothetical protein
MRCIACRACVETRPSYAGSPFIISSPLIALRKMPHPEVPRGARLEGRTPFFHPYGILAQPVGVSRRYSITSAVRARIDGGTVRPSASAVLRLTTRSNVVGCWTGRSAGFSSLRILPAYTPAWLETDVRLAP